MRRVRRVAIFGSSHGQPGEPLYDSVVSLGIMLASYGIQVETGGFAGVGMEAGPRGATHLQRGTAVGYTYNGLAGNEYLTREVDCQKLAAKIPFPHADYIIRLCGLLSNDAFVVVAGSGIGTFQELIATITFNEKLWPDDGELRRVAILKPASVKGRGWDRTMLSSIFSMCHVSPEVRKCYRVFKTSSGLVDYLTAED